jgi:tetratricopeptide (TPR) repeat protein
MPQVPASPQLRFTNHWIGIYARDSNLVPSLRVARKLRPVPPPEPLPIEFPPPADASSLKPLFERALADREKELGSRHAQTARSAFDLGMFLISTEGPAAAEKPLRKALGIDYANKDPLLAADQETLGTVLADIGNREEAIDLFERAARGPNQTIAARSYSRLAMLDADQAESYYRKALAAEEAASGKDHPKLASILNDLALALRSRNDDRSAEPLFRRALAIEQKALGAASDLTAMVQSNLGHLLHGDGQLDEAERLQRSALTIFEQKLGPDSKEVSTACTKLADVLWAKGNKVPAANLFRRALSIDESIHGPDHPEVAATLTNLGTILKETGATAEAEPFLRRALAIFVKTAGPNSPEADYVRESLQRSPR